MNTLTNQNQPLKNKAGRQRQTKEREKQTLPTLPHGELQQWEEQEEGLYLQVRQDERLRAYHTAKLLDTPGYSLLTEEEASEMVEQMLRLSCLVYEMLLEEGQPYSVGEAAATETNQNQTRQQTVSNKQQSLRR